MAGIKNALQTLLAWLESGRFADLVTTRHHTLYLTRHRLAAIVARIRLVAVSFSVLTLVWIAFDVSTFNSHLWFVLVAFRVVAAIIFIVLAILPIHDPSRVRVLTMLGIMLAIPLVIYAASAYLLAGLPLHGLGAMNKSLYDALPLVVLAGLSIFPVVTSEGLLFAGLILFAVSAIKLVLGGVAVLELLSTLWVLLLALGIYLLACAIQLHYMMSLLRQASYDLLTGALTRRSGVEVLDLYFRLACEQDTPFSVFFVDTDNFKWINDTYGHEAGDKALKVMAAKLKAYTRQADSVIRWGGDEFIVLLVNTPISGASVVIRRILENWLGDRPDGNPLTASIGLAERQADDIQDWPQLIALADERMYTAKTSGKACCVSREGIMPLPGQQTA